MATPVHRIAYPVALALIPLVLAVFYGAACDVWWPLVSVTVVGLPVVLWLRRTDEGIERRVCVLVLGDIGRSPRMQYHSLSLSQHGYDVTVVGFLDSKPHGDVLRDDRIHIVPVAEVKGIRGGPKILTYVTKVIVQFVQLFVVLLLLKPQAHILMQNPPGLPGIAAAWLVCVLRGSRFIIDWHNYGYTVMALSLGHTHPLVRVAKWYEHVFGPLATHNLCVTNAMKDDLYQNWGIKATTLYDRPAAIFQETPLKTQHKLFQRLSHTHPVFRHSSEDDDEAVEATVFSVRDPAKDTVTLRPGRPALLVSSTSWTGEVFVCTLVRVDTPTLHQGRLGCLFPSRWFPSPEDEDFSILLQALQEYEALIQRGASLPALVCVITGKGPQKEHYMKMIDSLSLRHVKICTPWLEAEDYPVLLGSADLGVCLHKSSSGLDLPMKVVDMFGCCLPVCAIHFSCLHELVKHEENGLIFRDCQQLAEQLRSLLLGFPNREGKLAVFRRNLRASRGQRWDDNWDQNVLPLMSSS
ncbi:chitobiosyldiphosphodolichol beta-mannosyltransferase isoform X2 [Dunckerocampus dactyliophorus]|uniref:chitobiosyldiphosphodolichol beta-mannosyltransferase isoform X2 n=1 Tax=Dunckerocampus dactyliophorus TaxID=161453 RepID=UPI0024057AD5|nr:chitobiosyldiphosphodolichol beta-mannosyltransferase isoform X2 [Dunckerocampus dactyliophorus]